MIKLLVHSSSSLPTDFVPGYYIQLECLPVVRCGSRKILGELGFIAAGALTSLIRVGVVPRRIAERDWGAFGALNVNWKGSV